MKMTIEAENAKEEIKEIIAGCIKCGLCKADCVVYKIMREETYSPRGKVLILEEGIYDEIFFSCVNCFRCELACPVGIKLNEAFRKARVVLVESGKASKSVKEILKNVQETGNIYGK